MDEVKQFIGTLTGKVIASLIIALLLFLTTMAWKGMNSDIEKRVSKLEEGQVRIKQDVVEIKGDILTAINSLIKDVKEQGVTITKLQSDVSYMKGLQDSKSKK